MPNHLTTDPFEDLKEGQDKKKEAFNNDPFADLVNIDAHTPAPDPITFQGQDAEGFLPSMDTDFLGFRAAKQPWYSKAFNSVVGGIGSGLLTAVEDVGYIGDLENNIARLQGIQEVESNWLSDLAKEGKEGIDTYLPVYKRSNKVFDWGDSGFYWTALKGILDSAVGFGLTGIAGGTAVKAATGAGKISKLLTLASRGTRGERSTAFLRSMAETGRLTEQAIQQLGTAAILNYGEGKMMALETYEQVMESLQPKIASGELSEEDAQKIAGDQADNFQLRNLAFIATDAFALSGLFRGKGLTRNLLQARTAKNLGTRLLQQAPVEYFEEVSQNVLQQEADYQARLEAGLDVSEYSSDIVERAIAFATTDQAQLEGLMGIFGGPAQFAAVQLPSYIATANSYNKSFMDQQQQIADNQRFMEEKKNFLLNGFSIKEGAIINNEDEVAELIDKTVFRNIAMDNFERGTTEDFEQRLENYTTEEDEASQSISQRLLSELKQLERDWLKASNYVNAREVFVTRQQIRDLEDIKSAKEGRVGSSRTNINNKIAEELQKPNNQKLTGLVFGVEDLEETKDHGATPEDKRIAKRILNKIIKTPEYKEFQKYDTDLDLVNEGLNLLDERHKFITSREGQQEAIQRQKEAIAQREEQLANQEISKNKEIAATKRAEKKTQEILDPTQDTLEPAIPTDPIEEANKENLETQEDISLESQFGVEEDEKRRLEEETNIFFFGKEEEGVSDPEQTSLFDTEEMQERFKKGRGFGKVSVQDIEDRDRANAEAAQDIRAGAKDTEVYTTKQEIRAEDEQERAEGIFQDENKSKLQQANNVLAFLSREYEIIKPTTSGAVKLRNIDNLLNDKLLDKNILDFNQFKPGTKITLEVDTDLEYIDEDGNTVTYNDLLSKGEDFIPIVAKKDGVRFAHLHIPEWITEDRVQQDVGIDIIDLRSIRRAVIEKGSISTTISNRTAGKLIKTFDGKRQNITIAFPSPDLSYGVVKDGELNLTKTNTSQIINQDTLKEGLTYALLPVLPNQVIAVPLNHKKIDDSVVQSIIFAVETYLAGQDSEIVNQLGETHPILTEAGLREYIRLFISPFRFDGQTNLRTYLSDVADSSITMLDVTGGAIEFGRGAGQEFFSLSKDSPNREFLLKKLGEHLKDMYAHVNLDLLNTNTRIPLIVSRDTIEDHSRSRDYNSYMKDQLETNLFSINIGTEEDPNYVYTIQPIIEFDTSFAFPKKQPKLTSEEKKKAQEGQGTDTPSGFLNTDDIGNEDLSPLTEKQVQRIKSRLTDGIIIRELGETRQRAIVSTLARHINKVVQKDGSIPFNDVFDQWKKSFEAISDHSEIKRLLDNWPQVKKATRLFVKRLRTVRMTDLDELNLSTFEKANFEENSIEQDTKDTISARLRRFFAGIEDRKPDLTVKKNFYGLPKIMDFDVTYNTVKRILANIDPSYEDMIRLLEENSTAHPFLQSVIEELEEAPQETKNEFVVAMTGHYVPMKFVMWIEGRLEIWDSNANSVAQVVKDTWINNLVSKDYTTLDDEVQDIINDSKIDELLNQSKDWNTKAKPSIEVLDTWLRQLGIELHPNTLLDLQQNGLGKARTYSSLFNPSSGVIGLLRKNLRTIQSNKLDINELFNNSTIFNLARVEAKYNRNVFSNSHRSGNKTVYSYSANKLLVDRTRKLLENQDLLDQLKESPFSSNSIWLRKLTDPNDKTFRDIFSYSYISLEPLKQKGTKSRDNRELDKLSSAEHELVKVGMFQSSNNPTLFYPTMSDKTTMLGLTVPKVDIKFKATEDEVSDTTIQAVYESLVLPEINRMISHKPGKANIEGYDRGANKFHFIPELNDIEELFVNFGTEHQKITDNILDEEKVLNKIKSIVRVHVENLVNDKVSEWKDLDITRLLDDRAKSKATSVIINNNNAVKYMAADYVINYLISNANIFQLYIGDPALYAKNTIEDTFNNIGKRLAADIAPGQVLADSITNTYKTVFLADRIANSVIEDYYDALGFDYTDINSTDAQEFTTWQEHLYVLKQLGRITDKEEKEIQRRLSKGKSLPANLTVKVFQPMKPVYTNMIYDQANKIHRRVYIKSSSIPLLPQLTKGLELDKLRKAMEKQGISRAAFSSAVKVGNFTDPVQIWNDDGTINADNLENLTLSTLTLPREGFRIQQDIPYKESKATINIGTQERKLLFLNLLGNEKYQKLNAEYNNHYSQLFQIQRRKLEIELSGNPDKLRSILRKEAEERNFPLNVIEGLELNEEGNFVLPLWATSSGSKYESLLNSIVANKIVKQKFPGHSYVLATQEGFIGTQEAQKGITFTDSYDPEVGLKPMREEKGTMKPAQVIIPSKIRDDKGRLINMRKYVDENSKFILDSKLLQLFGFRIPTQGLNSMSSLEIVGFLNKDAGDVIIAPRDFITQMGSDFDVDKLYTYQYNTIWNKDTGIPEIFEYSDELANKLFDEKTSNLRDVFGEDEDILEDLELFKLQLKEKDLQNKILDIHLQIMSDPSEEVQKQRAQPLGFGKLPELAAMVEAAKPKEKQFSPLSDSYQKFKYINATAGKAGVGVFSLDSVFNALSQNKNLKFKDVKFTIDRQTVGELSDPKTLKGKRFKSDIIAAFQSAAVDNEKEQLLDKLHINSFTFDTIRALAQLGYEEDVIAAVINQPIVIDYVNELRKLKQSTSEFVSGAEGIAYKNIFEDYLRKGKLSQDALRLLDNTTTRELLDMIVEKEKYPDYYSKQIGALDLFIYISGLGGDIAKVQGAISVDSRGIGKSFFESLNKEEQIKRLPQSDIINAEKLIGTYTGESIIPETVSGFAAVEGLFTNNDLWQRFFPYRNPAILASINKVLTITPRDFDFSSKRKADQQTEIWNEMKSYIYSQIIPDSELKRQELARGGKDSLSRYMQRQKGSKLFLSNSFLNKLGYEARNNKNLIKFNAASAENFDEIGIYGGFLDLIFNDTKLTDKGGKPYSTRQLGEDLVSYTLLSGGQQQAIEFSKYIPISYLKETDFFEKINSLKFEELFPQGAMNEFVEQYFQHHPGKAPQIIDLKKLENKDSNVIKKLTTFKIKDQNMVVSRGDKFTYPEFVSIYDKGNWYLYKNIGNKFQRINTLGTFGMKEYGATKSIYPINNKQAGTVESQPVQTLDLSGEIDNNNPYKAGSKYGFREGANAKKVLENLAKNGETDYVRQLAKVLANSNLDVKLRIDNNLPAKGKAEYNPNIITVNQSVLDDYDFVKTFLEETIHIATKQVIHNPQTEAQKQAKNRLSQIYKDFVSEIGSKRVDEVIEKVNKGIPLSEEEAEEVYAGKNLEEFVALAMLSPRLQERLKQQKYEDTNFFERILSAIREILRSLNIPINTKAAVAITDIITLINSSNTSSTSTSPDFSPKVARDAKFKDPLLGTIRGQIRDLQKRLVSVQTRLKSVRNKEVLKRLTELESNFRKGIERLQDQLKEVEDVKILEGIRIHGERHMGEVEAILSRSKVSYADIHYATRLVHLWSDPINTFFNENEKTSSKLREDFGAIQIKALEYSDKLTRISQDSVAQFTREQVGDIKDLNKIFEPKKDIPLLTREFLDISRTDDLILQSIFKSVKQANSAALEETQQSNKKLDGLISKLQKETGQKGEALFEVFKQTYRDGSQTGNLVYRFSQEFFDAKGKNVWSVFNQGTPNKRNLKKALDWLKTNEIVFDPAGSNDEELKRQLGEKGFTFYKGRLKEKLERYKLDKELAFDRIDDSELDNLEKQVEKDIWEKTHSPYEYFKRSKDAKVVKVGDKYITPRGYQYTYAVPKREANGKDTGWYDSKFQQIENNDTLLELYNFMIDTLLQLRSYLPEYKRRELQINTIPTIKKTLFENFAERGMTLGLSPLLDKWNQVIRESDISNIDLSQRDPVTGEVERALSTGFARTDKQQIKEIVERRVIFYKQDNNQEPSITQVKQFEKEARDAVAREKSFDLGKVLKMYSMLALSFKHKSRIEDQIRLAASTFSIIKKQETNAAGDELFDHNGDPIASGDLENYKKQLDFFMGQFYGSRPNTALKTKRKALTKEEKKLEEELKERLQDEGLLEEERATLQSQLDNLGGKVIGTKVADNVLKLVQLKGMGWNLFSAFANMGFGSIANLIEASDGRQFTMKQYFKAMNITRSSIIKNLSAHSIVSDNAKKVRSLMDQYDVLKDASQELYQGTTATVSKRFRFLQPYQLQKRSEYVNQAPVMIAIMLNTSIKEISGNESNLWEAYGPDGKLKEEFRTEENLKNWEGNIDDTDQNKFKFDLKTKIDRVIKMNHGNYDPDSTLKIKGDVWGRAFSQFRTWAFEGFANRFESRSYDSILGYDVEGRYRTLARFIGDSPFKNTLFTLKQLFRKMAGMDTRFGEQLVDETDIANMKKNLTELLLLMFFAGMALLLKQVALDEDDDETKYAINTTLNLMLRLQTDILFYFEPQSFEALSRNAIPAMGLVKDTYEWGDAAIKLLVGDDEIKSGIYSGHSRFLRETGQMLPFGVQGYRLFSIANQQFDK